MAESDPMTFDTDTATPSVGPVPLTKFKPGTYTAQLKIETEDPENDTIQVPVSMTVNPSPTYGKLWGTVRGLGTCDLNPAPIEGAQVQVLVGTLVVEVGVYVPNATLMTVEGADRFGLAQLHQLRGRVSRGAYPGFVCLIATAGNSDAGERLGSRPRGR